MFKKISNTMKSIKDKFTRKSNDLYFKAQNAVENAKAKFYIDKTVGIIICVVVGALLLGIVYAEAECFTFADGVKPTERDTDDIIAINNNHTINYVGWAGHMAFRNLKAFVPQPLIRVDYIKYSTGNKNYIM